MSKKAMKLAESLRDKYSDKIYDGCGRAAAMQFEVDVAALLEALAEQPAPVQGWKLVPVEPTQKMLDAPPNAYPADALVTWKAMLAAAPQPAQQEPVATVAEVHMSRYTIEWTNGPLPEGTELYTPPPAQRKPLTIAEVEQILGQHNYEIHGDRARYIVRMTEAAHNIKEQP